MELHFSFMRVCTSIVITFLFFSHAASGDSSYSWQRVQQNIRMRGGDYQRGISNQAVCKTRCVQNPDCIGVDWHDEYSSCFFLYDSNASSQSANGFRHWKIIRNRSTLIISQGTPAATTAAATTTTSATTIATTTSATTTTATTTTATTTAATTAVTAAATATTPVAITPAPATTPTATPTIRKRVISKELLIRQTSDTSTLETSTASVRSATPIVISGQSPRSVNEDKNTDVVDDFYSWQPVQPDMRSRTGDFQTGISNEDSCKTRCVRNPNCTGIDWHNSETACFLLYDCNASPNPGLGFRHWEIRRYKATTISCQDRRTVSPPHPTASMLCHSQDNLTTVKVLSVLLGFATVVIAVLMFNTWRLHQKIRSCTCQIKKVNFAQKAQENGYQSYNGTATQPAPYTDMVRTLPPIPNEVEIVYAAIDEDIHA